MLSTLRASQSADVILTAAKRHEQLAASSISSTLHLGLISYGSGMLAQGSQKGQGMRRKSVAAAGMGVKSILKKTAAAGGGAALAVVAAPVIVTSLGFTTAGITAGSTAAAMMSSAAASGGVAVGSTVAICQSIGAAGLGVGGKALVATVGAAAGSGTAAAVEKVNNAVSRIRSRL